MSIILIEPEAGEAEGDVVCFTYLFDASVSTSVSGDHAAASASTGHDEITAVGDVESTDNPLTFVLEGDVQISGVFGPVLSVPVIGRSGSWFLVLALLAAGLWFARSSRQRTRPA